MGDRLDGLDRGGEVGEARDDRIRWVALRRRQAYSPRLVTGTCTAMWRCRNFAGWPPRDLVDQADPLLWRAARSWPVLPQYDTNWLPPVAQGWTVGAGHVNMMEVPDQVNAMIEGFLRHHG